MRVNEKYPNPSDSESKMDRVKKAEYQTRLGWVGGLGKGWLRKGVGGGCIVMNVNEN